MIGPIEIKPICTQPGVIDHYLATGHMHMFDEMCFTLTTALMHMLPNHDQKMPPHFFASIANLSLMILAFMQDPGMVEYKNSRRALRQAYEYLKTQRQKLMDEFGYSEAEAARHLIPGYRYFATNWLEVTEG